MSRKLVLVRYMTHREYRDIDTHGIVTHIHIIANIETEKRTNREDNTENRGHQTQRQSQRQRQRWR